MLTRDPIIVPVDSLHISPELEDGAGYLALYTVGEDNMKTITKVECRGEGGD